MKDQRTPARAKPPYFDGAPVGPGMGWPQRFEGGLLGGETRCVSLRARRAEPGPTIFHFAGREDPVHIAFSKSIERGGHLSRADHIDADTESNLHVASRR